ncbi:MFS general substrate transporter [Polychaeton citri CBS 116435]|uniref:MFS general substrate transporter n=1 Tax=Polychaeton citri CBS 116435 TaxID=1314669 RepID=A0A9P4UIC6_9PEZI|nr:MFS general substrate transporter [Polychaeton citri CBS 116435]
MDQTSTQHDVELQQRDTSTENIPEYATGLGLGENHGQSLPQYDGGRAAWRLLLAAFVFEALLWGFPLSFGVFQNYYSRLPAFANHSFISVIGSTSSGISYLAAPFIIPFIRRRSKYRRHMILIGWPICLLSLVAGSFANSLGALIFTQGIMYGVGFVIFYYPILSMVNEFWVARRGMAYGLLCSASGVSGAAMPFCIEALLEKYGYQTTLRAIAVGLFVLTAPLIPLLKGRLPESEVSATAATKTDWTFLKTPLFWIYNASNLAMGAGYFFPGLYLPSYAISNGLSSTQGVVLLAIMSVSQVLGQVSYGYLSDQNPLPLNLLSISSTLTATVAVFACWGLAHTFPLLVVFSLVYGFFGAGYTAMWARMGTAISSEPTAAFAVFGLLNFGKGIGNVLAGPISGALLKSATELDDDSYGTRRYRLIVLFTGSCMCASAAMVALCYVKRLPSCCSLVLFQRR